MARLQLKGDLHVGNTMNIIKYIVAYGMLALVFAVFLIPLIASIKSKIEERREREGVSKKVHDAIEKITADGKIEGHKGNYVPHHKYGTMTDRSTSPPKHNGIYHHPWA